jgi:putative colanic acid biosynthesis glycosyltransferase
MLTVITVVRNDFDALLLTEKSIARQRDLGTNIEWIIIDGNSTDKTREYFSKEKSTVQIFVSENDNGIYDAMNKGIRLASGFGLIFLNAGDYFVGNILSKIKPDDIPCFLKVKYLSYFGKLSTRRIVNERLGISNCHQGIIFNNNKKILYDTEYSICADYKYFLEHGYTSKLNYYNGDGYVYWNQGISLQNWKIRDKEIFKIRKEHFGNKIAYIYEIRHFIKRLLRIFIFHN